MISVAAAKALIHEHTEALAPRQIHLGEAGGLVLAEDMFAAVAIPDFYQSSMDGYAFSFHGWQLHRRLQIKGMVAAGSDYGGTLGPAEAVRIFTGAPLPAGADTVVMQEKTRVENNELVIDGASPEPGMHVRLPGSEIAKGRLALEKNNLLTPAATGFLASIGINNVNVYPNPAISIIVTGDELQEPGQPLHYGQVYECNAYTLKAALHQLHMHDIQVYRVKDQLGSLVQALEQALQQTDMVFLSGGVSVGDFDFVLEAAARLGVQQVFHKVKQRPAKPLYFGRKGNTRVMGLPGNPASALVSFYEYALPALSIMSGRKLNLQVKMAALEHSFSKPAGLTYFLKGWYNGATVRVLDAQESYRLSSFARANCLVQADEASTGHAAGEAVEIHVLPAS